MGKKKIEPEREQEVDKAVSLLHDTRNKIL